MELEFELTNNIIPEVKTWANKLLHTVPCLFFFACYARKKILPPTKCSHNYVRTCENFVSACENTFLTCENSCSHEAFSVSRYLLRFGENRGISGNIHTSGNVFHFLYSHLHNNMIFPLCFFNPLIFIFEIMCTE